MVMNHSLIFMYVPIMHVARSISTRVKWSGVASFQSGSFGAAFSTSLNSTWVLLKASIYDLEGSVWGGKQDCFLGLLLKYSSHMEISQTRVLSHYFIHLLLYVSIRVRRKSQSFQKSKMLKLKRIGILCRALLVDLWTNLNKNQDIASQNSS